MALPDYPDLEALGQYIRNRRLELGLTQTEFGNRVGYVQERISSLEHGRYGLPSLPALIRLAECLEVPFHELLSATGYAESLVVSDGATPGGARIDPARYYTLERLLAIDAIHLRDVLNQASDLLVSAMGADKIDAFMYEPEKETLHALGTSNTPMGRRQHEVGLERLPLANNGRVVDVFRTGVPYCTGHAESDPGISVGVVRVLGVRSLVAVPLRVNGETKGVLVAESAQSNRFTDEEERFFLTVGRWVGMVAHHAQIHEAMQLAAAEEGRRLAADEIVTALSHDLGNALAPLKGRIDLLQRRFQREKRERDLQDILDAQRAVATIEEMVTSLLDVSRLEHGLFTLSSQPVDLSAVVTDTVATLDGYSTQVDVRLVDDLEVEADPLRLRQVIVNLVSNSIRHSPDGTPIQIGTGEEQRDDGRWAVMSIQDEGPGIESDILPHIFERFTASARSDGLGLGLYLARKVVEAHGGTLTATSVPGRGTTFWLALPRMSRD